VLDFQQQTFIARECADRSKWRQLVQTTYAVEFQHDDDVVDDNNETDATVLYILACPHINPNVKMKNFVRSSHSFSKINADDQVQLPYVTCAAL